MDVKTVIIEVLEMMAFTFLVGMRVAYIIKILVELFHFFRTGNVSSVVLQLKGKVTYERKRRSEIRKIISLMEKDSDVEFLRYLYENKNKHYTEENVEEFHHLFNFYKGIYKDKKESDGINDLIKYYNGEV